MKNFKRNPNFVIAIPTEGREKQSQIQTASYLAVTEKLFIETESLALKAHSFN